MSFEIQVDVPVSGPRTTSTDRALVDGPVWVKATGAHVPGDLWLEFERKDGYWTCRRLRLDSDDPLSSTLLRRIPLTAIVEAGARDLVNRDRDVMKQRMLDGGFTERDIELLETKVSAKRSRRSGPDGPTPDELQRFATSYRFALWTVAKNPIAMTMELLADQGLPISRATANRWRELCRRAAPPLLPDEDAPSTWTTAEGRQV